MKDVLRSYARLEPGAPSEFAGIFSQRILAEIFVFKRRRKTHLQAKREAFFLAEVFSQRLAE